MARLDPALVGDAEYRRLGDLRMGEEHHFDLVASDVFAPGLDRVLLGAGVAVDPAGP